MLCTGSVVCCSGIWILSASARCSSQAGHRGPWVRDWGLRSSKNAEAEQGIICSLGLSVEWLSGLQVDVLEWSETPTSAFTSATISGDYVERAIAHGPWLASAALELCFI